MKNIFAKVLVLGALLLSASVALPVEGAKFDGPGPTPTCLPPGIPCPDGL